MAATGYVYVIVDSSGRHKIGHGAPVKRLTNLQTGNADKLELIHTEACDASLAAAAEELAKAYLADKHCRGEWFSATAEEAIEAVKRAVREAVQASAVPGPIPQLHYLSAEDLKHWRKRHALTQDQAAALLGVAVYQWRKRESGHAAISRETEFACRYIDENPHIIGHPTGRAPTTNNDARILGTRSVERIDTPSPTDNAHLIQRALDENNIEQIIFYGITQNAKKYGIAHRIGALIATTYAVFLFDRSECHISTSAPHRVNEVRAFIEKAIRLYPQRTFTLERKLLSFELPQEKRESAIFLQKAPKLPLHSYDEFFEIVRLFDPEVY